MHHYMTKYTDNKDNEYYTSWLQINFLGRSYIFSKKEYKNGKRVDK